MHCDITIEIYNKFNKRMYIYIFYNWFHQLIVACQNPPCLLNPVTSPSLTRVVGGRWKTRRPAKSYSQFFGVVVHTISFSFSCYLFSLWFVIFFVIGLNFLFLFSFPLLSVDIFVYSLCSLLLSTLYFPDLMIKVFFRNRFLFLVVSVSLPRAHSMSIFF